MNTQRESYQTGQNGNQKREIVLQAIKANNGATLFEICKLLQWPVNRVSGRVTELSQDGLIVDVGQRRKNPESGKSGVVWVDIQSARLCGKCEKWFRFHEEPELRCVCPTCN